MEATNLYHNMSSFQQNETPSTSSRYSPLLLSNESYFPIGTQSLENWYTENEHNMRVDEAETLFEQFDTDANGMHYNEFEYNPATSTNSPASSVSAVSAGSSAFEISSASSASEMSSASSVSEISVGSSPSGITVRSSVSKISAGSIASAASPGYSTVKIPTEPEASNSSGSSVSFTANWNKISKNAFPTDMQNDFGNEKDVLQLNKDSATRETQLNETDSFSFEFLPTATPRWATFASDGTAQACSSKKVLSTNDWYGYTEDILKPSQETENVNQKEDIHLELFPSTSTTYAGSSASAYNKAIEGSAENVPSTTDWAIYMNDKYLQYYQKEFTKTKSILKTKQQVTERDDRYAHKAVVTQPSTSTTYSNLSSVNRYGPTSSRGNVLSMKGRNQRVENKYPVDLKDNVTSVFKPSQKLTDSFEKNGLPHSHSIDFSLNTFPAHIKNTPSVKNENDYTVDMSSNSVNVTQPLRTYSMRAKDSSQSNPVDCHNTSQSLPITSNLFTYSASLPTCQRETPDLNKIINSSKGKTLNTLLTSASLLRNKFVSGSSQSNAAQVPFCQSSSSATAIPTPQFTCSANLLSSTTKYLGSSDLFRNLLGPSTSSATTVPVDLSTSRATTVPVDSSTSRPTIISIGPSTSRATITSLRPSTSLAASTTILPSTNTFQKPVLNYMQELQKPSTSHDISTSSFLPSASFIKPAALSSLRFTDTQEKIHQKKRIQTTENRTVKKQRKAKQKEPEFIDLEPDEDVPLENLLQFKLRKDLEFENVQLKNLLQFKLRKSYCTACCNLVEYDQVLVLQNCYHSLCRNCLTNAVQLSETAAVKCPHRLPGLDGSYCHNYLQPNEFQDFVTPEVYQAYLQKTKLVVESKTQSSDPFNVSKFFLCVMPDCAGCLYVEESNVSTFRCPVCKRNNCIKCIAVHEGKTCQEFQKECHQKKLQKEFEGKESYQHLVALDNIDLVANAEKFECPICFTEIDVGDGATLRDCLHSFCKECLAGAIQHCETATVRCPFQNDEYSCESDLQEREVKALVSQEVYEKYLQRSVALAENQAQNSFHCKTPDCPGWCLYEDGVNFFHCPACNHINCLTCAAIHEGMNCRQYQDDLAFRSDTNEDVKRTRDYLQTMLHQGDAMRCPQCKVILMKKEGCDWIKCSMCQLAICWITKGPRWGPGGLGDNSGGCRCKINGNLCHPKCRGCH